MTDGGEGAYGRYPNQITKDKISKAVKENSHWKNGVKHTAETIEKIRIASINMNRINIGKKISKAKKVN